MEAQVIWESKWFDGADDLLREACFGPVLHIPRQMVEEGKGQLFRFDFGPRAQGAFITQICEDSRGQYLVVHAVGGTGFFQHVAQRIIDLARRRGFYQIVVKTFKPGIQRLASRFGFETRDVFFDDGMPDQVGGVLIKFL